MLVSFSEKNGILVAKLDGERIDAGQAISFSNDMNEKIAEGNTSFVLDLSKVTFIDSSGLGAIVAVHKKVATSGGLTLAALQGSVLMMFKMTRMDKVFKMFDDVEAAVAELNSK